MIGRLAAWTLAGVLLATGVAKLLDQPAFGTALASVGLLPPVAARVLVLILPWIEVVTAVALLRPTWRRAGALVALVLSLGFVGYSCLGAWLQRPPTCGCFGKTRLVTGWIQHAIVAAAMVGAAIMAWRATPSPSSPPATA